MNERQRYEVYRGSAGAIVALNGEENVTETLRFVA